MKGDPAESGSAPYHIWVEIFGIFPEERTDKERLLLLTGAAMLYGAVSPEVFLQAAERRKAMLVQGEGV